MITKTIFWDSLEAEAQETALAICERMGWRAYFDQMGKQTKLKIVVPSADEDMCDFIFELFM